MMKPVEYFEKYNKKKIHEVRRKRKKGIMKNEKGKI